MSYKTILVHCDANPRLSQRLDVAVDLAQRFAAHLVGAPTCGANRYSGLFRWRDADADVRLLRRLRGFREG